MPKKFKYKYKQTNNKIVIISIIILLLLLSSGIGGYFYYKSKQDKKKEIITTKSDLNTEVSNVAQTTRPNIITPRPTTRIISESNPIIQSEIKSIPTISPKCNRIRCNNIMKFYIDNRPYFLDSTAWFSECDFCPSRYYKPPNAIKINELTINNIESLIDGNAINDPARLPITSEQKDQSYNFLKLPN